MPTVRRRRARGQAVIALSPDLSPFSGLQFFGEVNIDAYSGVMTVDLRDIAGVSVFSRKLQPRTW